MHVDNFFVLLHRLCKESCRDVICPLWTHSMMACGHEFIMCGWWNEGNCLISESVWESVSVEYMCLRQWVVGNVCSSIFCNTVMDIGTFARLGPEPLTYHLQRERKTSRDGHKYWLHIQMKREKIWQSNKKKPERKVLIKSGSTETRTTYLIFKVL